MGISEITLYNLLRKKMGEQETYELMEFIHLEVKTELDTRTNIFMSKEDKVDLIDRINDVNTLAEKTKLDLIVRINSLSINADSTRLNLIDRINNVAVNADKAKLELIDRINSVAVNTDKAKLELTEQINIVSINADNTKLELIDRINNIKSELIVWLVSLTVLQYILLMITKKIFLIAFTNTSPYNSISAFSIRTERLHRQDIHRHHRLQGPGL